MSFGGEGRRVVLDEYDVRAAGSVGAGFERLLGVGERVERGGALGCGGRHEGDGPGHGGVGVLHADRIGGHGAALAQARQGAAVPRQGS